jgi:hypothetical protein
MLNKEKLFEFVVKKLAEWYQEQNQNQDINDNNFGTLKVLKLLFFVCSCRAHLDSSLIDIFDDFYAMPFGHIEKDILSLLKQNNGKFENIEITDSKTIFNNLFTECPDDKEILKSIDDSIDYLKEKNPILINYSALSLVDLSRIFYSWNRYYRLAKKDNTYSMKIPKEFIISEDKIFSLQSY